TYEVLGPGAVRVAWTLGNGARLVLDANLGAEPLRREPDGPAAGRVLWAEGPADGPERGPWSVLWMLDETR
ncbi:MAG: DUF3459 domain-containing protein, partial [Rhizobiales bacterium]|nr:DUF3459 domain-containing protein [Hyphomicrobiales bacterium]